MWLTIGLVLVGLCGLAIWWVSRASRADLGWMSQQWLAEHRAGGR